MAPTFSVQDIPFSYRGSWFGISPVIAEKTYADDLHLVSHQTGMHPVLRFEARDGAARADPAIVATPSRLTWLGDGGRIDLVFDNHDTIRVRGEGLGLRLAAAATELTPFSGTYLYTDPVDGSHVFTSYETGRRYRVTVLAGDPVVAGSQLLGVGERHVDLPSGTTWEIAVEEYATARARYSSTASFAQVADAVHKQFALFLEAVAPWRSDRTPAADLAAYVMWSATVDPGGFVTRPAVLMSKHWMDKVWSWDHCFNAIALATGDPGLAWDQFRLPFDHQDPAGALPDSVTHSEVLHNFVKPPIHGWALGLLRERAHLDPEHLREVYESLSRWTRFWLTGRRAPGHELAHYQHGNDSGWDNATTFDEHRVLETADLAAFLVTQLRELATLAAELDEPADAQQWSADADRMRDALLDQLWDGDRFIARSPFTGLPSTSASLLALMPIVLGADLPAEVGERLAAGLRAHLTAHGLATEPVDSPHYAADGYWRGPIWAPSTVLIEDGLRRAGHTELADEVSRRFRALCEKSGFAENFDAETGAGLRDRAYTWTASSYLILAAAYEGR
ncbi:amylo-alpha-1,6-glucosidase [Actinoplanes awajinensis]|uniref:Glycogen debranching protein n=1 Tax=Actinoplanes awajinensis subsp. mycoplanecinus TaxID=135947 RepID=A0A101JRM9_9ACTN|nr:trehalase family glycosidase [Actinoplanes awajinensis]KUL31714.1 glycogen debranching protein [Actinoplanes awajinensis subsp. mycoplanecinus]